MKFPYEEFDLSGVRTYPLASRASKAHHEDFARPWHPETGLHGWLASLPNMLAAADFRAVVAAIQQARADERGIVWGLGAHVIKVGLSPIVIDLMERGFVSALALNGAGLIHDFELALSGATSEEVDHNLGPGKFGMADETGRLLNEAIADGVGQGLGLGQSVVGFLERHRPHFGRFSVLMAAGRLGIPVTIHVFVSPGIADEKRMRSLEYDTVDDTYARFLRDELLPEVARRYELRQDSYSRAIAVDPNNQIAHDGMTRLR